MLDLSDKHLAPAGPRAVAHHASDLSPSAAVLPDVGHAYRHYKGGLYRVEGLCTIEASMEPGVLYRAFDPHQKHRLFMRPVAEFMGPVNAQTAQARFSPLHQPTRAALDALVPADLVPKEVLEDVLRAYDGAQRFYHSRERVYELFERAQAAELTLSREQLVALLFLDVVYVPGVPEGTNEKLSALLLHDKAQSMGEFDVDKAARIVQDSATGLASIVESNEVLDLDRVSLAGAPVQFCAAEELIWLENRHLLDKDNARKDFDTRRLKFLLARAQQGRLFHERFAHLEEAARNNLEGLRQAWMRKYQKEKKGG